MTKKILLPIAESVATYNIPDTVKEKVTYNIWQIPLFSESSRVVPTNKTEFDSDSNTLIGLDKFVALMHEMYNVSNLFFKL